MPEQFFAVLGHRQAARRAAKQAAADLFFQPPDLVADGRLGQVLALRRLNIEDKRWQRAMTAISDAIQITGSRSYLRVYEPLGALKAPLAARVRAAWASSRSGSRPGRSEGSALSRATRWCRCSTRCR